MLAKRIIPTILINGRQQVKGKQFKAWRRVGLAAQAVKIHQSRGVDELILLDVMATKEKRGPDLELIKELSDGLFSPLTVGGGVKTVQDVENLLRAGADKVALCTWIMDGRSTLLADCVARFGSQAIVAVVECNKNPLTEYCSTHSGTREWFALPYTQAIRYSEAGAGEILLSDVPRDGMMTGYNLGLIRAVSKAVDVPLVVSGGCGSYDDMLEAIRAGADGVAAGAMFQFTDQTPRGAAEYLKEHGVEVRLETIA